MNGKCVALAETCKEEGREAKVASRYYQMDYMLRAMPMDTKREAVEKNAAVLSIL